MKIDLFAPPRSRYGSLHYMTERLMEALQKQDVETRLFEASAAQDPEKFLKDLVTHQADCTLSFNGLLPDDNGNFLCNQLAIPHIAYLVDSPNAFFPLVGSPLSIIACVDRFYAEFFRGFDFDNSFFLPHAADPTLSGSDERPYEIVMFSSYIDPEDIRARWDPELADVLMHAATLTLSDQTTSYIEAFTIAMNRSLIDATKLNLPVVFSDLEDYIRAVDRISMLKGLKTGHLHIFGEGNWSKIVPELSVQTTVHEAIPFPEVIEIMKQSQIVLNSAPTLKMAGHIRLFTALVCGAACITSENAYLKQDFDIPMYKHDEWDAVGEIASELLENPFKRKAVADAGAEVVRSKHTWDHRASELLQNIKPILERINE